MENLNEFINQFGHTRCLVFLNNFQEIDLSPWGHPLTLRQLAPALMWESRKKIKITRSFEFVWKQGKHSDFNRTNFFTFEKDHFKCLLSSFLVGGSLKHYFESLSDICVRLHLLAFSSKSKPWNCQAQFGMFPDDYIFIKSDNFQPFPKLYYPRNFYSPDIHDYWCTLPATVPLAKNLVLEYYKWSNLQRVNNMKTWINGVVRHPHLMDMNGKVTSHDVFMIMTVKSFGRIKKLGYISEVYQLVINICNGRHVVEQIIRPSDALVKLFTTEEKDFTSDQIWSADDIFYSKGAGMGDVICFCTDFKTYRFSAIKLDSLRHVKPHEILHKLNYDVWISIFKNLTVFRVTSDRCYNVQDFLDGIQIQLMESFCFDCLHYDFPLWVNMTSENFTSSVAVRSVEWMHYYLENFIKYLTSGFGQLFFFLLV